MEKVQGKRVGGWLEMSRNGIQRARWRTEGGGVNNVKETW